MDQNIYNSWEEPFDPSEPKIAQIVRNFKREIKEGRMKPGDPMPSVRAISEKFKVSHGTAEKAHEALKEKGLIVTVPQKGTMVKLIDSGGRDTLGKLIDPGWGKVSPYPLYGTPEVYETPYLSYHQPYPRIDLISLSSFGNVYTAVKKDMLGDGKDGSSFDPDEEIRREVRSYLKNRRVNIENAGFQLVARRKVLQFTAANVAGGGGCMVMDSPDDRHAYQAFKRTGLPVRFAGSDSEGMRVTEVERLCRTQRVAALFVRPGVSYPYNVMMSDRRRQELIAVAKEYRLAVIEMDMDHELVFRPRLSPLAAREHGGLVTYITSLSKHTALLDETCVVVTNADLKDMLAGALQMADSWTDRFHLLAQLRIVNTGLMKGDADKIPGVYRSLLSSVSELFDRFLKGRATLVLPPAGLRIWIRLHRGVEQRTLAALLEEAGFRNADGYVQFSPETRIRALDLGAGGNDLGQWKRLFRGLRRVVQA